MEYNEKEILKSLSKPDTCRQAFSMIVHRFSEPLYWKIRHILLSHEDTNDVLQNTFLKAWNNIDGFQGKSQLSTWLYRIAVNEALDFLRKQSKARLVSTEDDVSVAERLLADEYFDGDEASARLHQAIATLPEVQRMVFNLRYFDDMKYSEMSKILDTSEGALKASYHIAVKKITEYFKDDD